MQEQPAGQTPELVLGAHWGQLAMPVPMCGDKPRVAVPIPCARGSQQGGGTLGVTLQSSQPLAAGRHWEAAVAPNGSAGWDTATWHLCPVPPRLFLAGLGNGGQGPRIIPHPSRCHQQKQRDRQRAHPDKRHAEHGQKPPLPSSLNSCLRPHPRPCNQAPQNRCIEGCPALSASLVLRAQPVVSRGGKGTWRSRAACQQATSDILPARGAAAVAGAVQSCDTFVGFLPQPAPLEDRSAAEPGSARPAPRRAPRVLCRACLLL